MIKKEELERVWEVFSLEKRQIGINPFNADKECVMYERFEEFYSNFSSCLEEKKCLLPTKSYKGFGLSKVE